MRFARHAEVYPDNSQRRRVIRSKDRAAMFTRSIHPQNSGLSVSPRPLFLYFSPSNIRNLSPSLSILFDNRSPEKDFHIFPRTNIHFLSFSRVSTRVAFPPWFLSHGFKFKIVFHRFVQCYYYYHTEEIISWKSENEEWRFIVSRLTV